MKVTICASIVIKLRTIPYEFVAHVPFCPQQTQKKVKVQQIIRELLLQGAGLTRDLYDPITVVSDWHWEIRPFIHLQDWMLN